MLDFCTNYVLRISLSYFGMGNLFSTMLDLKEQVIIYL